MRRVLVIVPPSSYSEALRDDCTIRAPFEGAAIAATMLSHQLRGRERVVCHDLRIEPHRVEELLQNHRPGDILLVTGSPDAFAFVKDFSRRVRARETSLGCGHAPIVLGGALATVSSSAVLQQTNVDYCLIGECEHVLPQLVEAVLKGDSVGHLPVASRDCDAQRGASHVDQCRWTADMDTVPCPDYSLWEPSHGELLREVVCYSTQRGCPHRCGFCANPHGRTVRWASLGKIKADLRQLRDQQRFKSVCFNDPTFNTDPERCIHIARTMEELDMPWVCLVRAKPVPDDLLETMRECGCQTLLLGIESADQRILSSASKGTMVEDIESCLYAAEKASLPVVGFLILGLPGETRASLEATERFALAHSFYPRPFYAVPYPGTQLYDMYAGEMRRPDESPVDFESRVLLEMSGLRYDGSDEPFDLPGRAVRPAELRRAMARIMSIAETRASRILLPA